MKNFRSLFTTLALALIATAATAQVKVGDNPTTIDASSVLEVESTTGGFLLPRMTEAQRDAIVSPATGLMVYNTTVPCLQVNDGTPASPEWNCISGIMAAPAEASTNGTGIVSAYGTPGCTAGSISGTMTEGEDASGTTMTIYANVTQVGTYDITAGPVNGVTFSGSGTFAATGCQEITLTATGTPTAAGNHDYSLNTTPGETVTATVAAAIGSYPAGYVHCDPANPTVVNDVTNPATGEIWMDRNLGASQVATSYTDAAAYGDSYQWGRFADGHQCRTSGTTTANATTAVPNAGNPWDGLFILETATDPDWLTSQNDNLWQGVNGVNNPCPIGYRLPTEAELEAELLSWAGTNDTGAFASPLKWTATGIRSPSDGSFAFGSNSKLGFYWSSSVLSNLAWGLSIQDSDAFNDLDFRATGAAVRCIKD
ncbi:fibrobacter succinogenes major paralogous domain-containing protein [Phaeodactylibacter luteus]|uniref:Fibrobacter succinogenes major paralogous domain-containing protein n=1 Tax=Phaeodactylibacter luteus TaxID=1564516 RepID=A0A5C6RKG3_9BACT|nr:hypothetical protein [Phaeodactylibacter luteus]TXB62717.1 hypothetical protein FRY97_12780 [Phaeodactylibacter luteus]